MVERVPTKMAKTGHLCLCSTPLRLGVGVHPRRRAPPRRRHLLLGEPKVKFSELSGLPRRTSPPRRSEASPRHTCKLCFSSSLLLILTIIHWINEDPNKLMKGFVQV